MSGLFVYNNIYYHSPIGLQHLHPVTFGLDCTHTCTCTCTSDQLLAIIQVYEGIVQNMQRKIQSEVHNEGAYSYTYTYMYIYSTKDLEV